MVYTRQARSAMARDSRSLQNPGFGDHAATDACAGGDPLLSEISAPVPHRSGSCFCRGIRSAPLLEWPRILPARPESAARGAENRRARRIPENVRGDFEVAR